MRPWIAAWGLQGLERGIEVTFDRRLRRSLGRCRPAEGRVSLHPALRTASPRAIGAVLCHEVAHIATYHLYGRATHPHGDEWRALVRAVGFDPSARSTSLGLDLALAPGRRAVKERRRVPRTLFVHRCPVCQTERVARRAMPRWRCSECVDAGLDGRLVISPRSGERT